VLPEIDLGVLLLPLCSFAIKSGRGAVDPIPHPVKRSVRSAEPPPGFAAAR
jgi:hypothetical protein